jgi:hypothetical protein
MVRSLINKDVEYREARTLQNEDQNYETSLYEAEIYNTRVIIALGQAKQDFSSEEIVYYPIYLINTNIRNIHTKIGVYEVTESDAAINIDEDGEPDIALLGDPLLFTFVTKSFIAKHQASLNVEQMVVVDGAEKDGAEKDGAEKDGVEKDGVEKDGAVEFDESAAKKLVEDTIPYIDVSSSWGDFKKKMYAISGKPKNEYKKMHAFMREYLRQRLQEDKNETPDSVSPPNPDKSSSTKFIRAPVPSDGWCSMHAVDQFLKYVGVFDEIPGNNEVPISLKALALPGNKYITTPAIQEWMEKFRKDQTLWSADYGDGVHSTPDAACEYIQAKTRDNYECLRNVFSMALDNLPSSVKGKQRYTIEEIKEIINTDENMVLFRTDPSATTAEETDRMVEQLQVVIFVNTGNHWEIIYSPEIQKVFFETPRPENPPTPEKIEVGSRVTWTKNGKTFNGEVVKITPKTYKICCKPNKTKTDANSLYMISKGEAKLEKNRS